jgi:hypothetical protein
MLLNQSHELGVDQLAMEHSLNVAKVFHGLLKGKLFTTDAMCKLHENVIHYILQHAVAFQNKKDQKIRAYYVLLFKILKVFSSNLSPAENTRV